MDSEGFFYTVYTREVKTVSEYTSLNFNEVQDLDYDEFLLILRDAFIYNCEKTKEGRAYLENAYLLEQTKPDRQTLRETFGKKGGI